jgi:hypothetical protein
MLFNTRVLKFRAMETTNIYDFLYLLSQNQTCCRFYGEFGIRMSMPQDTFIFFYYC